MSLPLDTSEDRRHVICWAPTVLQDVQAKLAGAVHIGVKHLADEFDAGRFVGVLFLEVHDEAECAVLKGSIGGSNDHGIPAAPSQRRYAGDDSEAYQVMTLSATGDADTPAGGSVCIRCASVVSSRDRVNEASV